MVRIALLKKFPQQNNYLFKVDKKAIKKDYPGQKIYILL